MIWPVMKLGLVRGQEDRGADQFRRLTQTLHGDVGRHLGVDLGLGQELPGHVGHDQGRGDGVDLDAVLGPLRRERAGELVHAALAGGVGGAAHAGGHPAAHRGHVDDAAVLLRDHDPADGLASQERAEDVDAQDPLELLGGHLLGVEPRVGAGHVDEDVDLAELLHGLLGHVLHRRGVGEVGGDRHGRAPEGLDLLDRGRQMFGVEVVDHHVRAALRQRDRDGATQPAAAARHDRDLACQIEHRSSFSLGESGHDLRASLAVLRGTA